MKVILTGGGTGGHIYPAIAIADRIMKESPESEVLFIGTRRGKEAELVPGAGYAIRYVKVQGLDRRSLMKNFATARDFVFSLKLCSAILNEFKPDLVIGTGGYVSAPVLQAAAIKKIPYYIQEQNALPGLVNRMLERGARKVFLGFAEASSRFRHPEKHVVTGNPVRAGFFSADRDACRAGLGLGKNEFLLLAFGGSQGAGRINRAMVHVIRHYNGASGVRIIFVPGKYYHLPVMTEFSDAGIKLEDNIEISEYIGDMDSVLPAADLVISRSGALTVSELAVAGRASILIPSPIVTGDHQRFNAKVLADRGAAILLDESGLEDEGLLEVIERLRMDSEGRRRMEQLAREAAPSDATLEIWKGIQP